MASYREIEIIKSSASWVIAAMTLTVNVIDDMMRKTRNKKEIDMLRNSWGKKAVDDNGIFYILNTEKLPVSPSEIKRVAKEEGIDIFYEEDEKRIFASQKDIYALLNAVQNAYKNGYVEFDSTEYKNAKGEWKSLKDIQNELDEINKKFKNAGLDRVNEYTEFLSSDIGIPYNRIIELCNIAGIVYERDDDAESIFVNKLFVDGFQKLFSSQYIDFKVSSLPEDVDYQKVLEICDKNKIAYFLDISDDNDIVFSVYNDDVALFNDIIKGNEIHKYETIELDYVDVTKEELEKICLNNNIQFHLNYNETEFVVESKDYELLRNKVLEMIEEENSISSLSKDEREFFDEFLSEFNSDSELNISNNSGEHKEINNDSESNNNTVKNEPIDIEDKILEEKKKQKNVSKKYYVEEKQKLQDAVMSEYISSAVKETKEYTDKNNNINHDIKSNEYNNSGESNGNYENGIVELNIKNYNEGRNSAESNKDKISLYKKEVFLNDGTKVHVEKGKIFDGSNKEIKCKNVDEFISKHGGVSSDSYYNTLNYIKKQDSIYRKRYSNISEKQSADLYFLMNKKKEEDYRKSIQDVKKMNERLNKSGASRNQTERVYSGFSGSGSVSGSNSSGEYSPYSSLLENMRKSAEYSKMNYVAHKINEENTKTFLQSGFNISQALYSERELNREKNGLLKNRENDRFYATVESGRTSKMPTGINMRGYNRAVERLIKTPIDVAMSGTALGNGFESARYPYRMISGCISADIHRSMYNYNCRTINDFRLNNYQFVRSLSKAGITSVTLGGNVYYFSDLGNINENNLKIYEKFLSEYIRKKGPLKPGDPMLLMEKQIKNARNNLKYSNKRVKILNAGGSIFRRQFYDISGFGEISDVISLTRSGIRVANAARIMELRFRNLTSLDASKARLQRKLNSSVIGSPEAERYAKKINRINKFDDKLNAASRIKESARINTRRKIENARKKAFDTRLGQKYSSTKLSINNKLNAINSARNEKINKIKNSFLFKKRNLPKGIQNIQEFFGKISAGLGKRFSVLSALGAKVIAVAGIVLLIYVAACFFLLVITNLLISDKDSVNKNYKTLHKMETALYDAESLGIVGDNATLNNIIYSSTENYPLSFGYRGNNSDLNGINLNVNGYFRLKGNNTATVDDLLAATDKNGELIAGFDGYNYYLYGFNKHDKFGSVTDKSHLLGWYNKKEMKNGLNYYDGIVYTPVKSDMQSKTGMSSNIVAIMSMSSYVFDFDLASNNTDSTSSYVQSAMKNKDKMPDNWLVYYYTYGSTSDSFYIIIEYTGENKPTDSEIQSYVELSGINPNYNGGTMRMLSDMEIQNWADSYGIELNIDNSAQLYNRQERISWYLVEMYNRSHIMNLSFVTTSYDEIVRSENGGGGNLAQTVDKSKNAEIFKLHKSQFVGGLGSETKIESSSNKLNACEDDGEVINDYLSHEGIMACISEEVAYVNEYNSTHMAVAEAEANEYIDDINTLIELESYCNSLHYVPPKYNFRISVIVSWTETWQTPKRDPDTHEIISGSYQTNSFGQNTSFEYSVVCSLDELEEEIANAEQKAAESITGSNGGAVTINNVEGTMMSQSPEPVEEEYWECDQPDYSDSLHLYQHCGGHFYINLELFTSEFSSPDEYDLFSIDDKYADEDGNGISLAEKYGIKWIENTDGTGRWHDPNDIHAGTVVMDVVENINSNEIIAQFGLEDKIRPSRSIHYLYSMIPLANKEKYKLMLPMYMSEDQEDLIELGSTITDEDLSNIYTKIKENDGEMRAAMCNVAVKAVGNIGYFYAGSSSATTPGSFPSGLDCSGYVTWVYYQFNREVLIENEELQTAYKNLFGIYDMDNFGSRFPRFSTTGFASDTDWFTTIDASQLKAGDILLKTSGTASAYTSSNHSAIYLGYFERNGETRYWYVQEGGDSMSENVNIKGVTSLYQLPFDTFRTFKYFDNIDSAYEESQKGIIIGN